MSISPPELDLHSRSRLAGYEPARLDATVLIVGMGALGQNTALNLALSGVREVRVVDADRFEAHNRTRSPLYPAEGGAGAPKATATAAGLLRSVTHPAAVVRFADAWIEDLGAAAFDDVSVVVSCVDSGTARAYLADRCSELGLPLVEAGFEGPEVNVAVFPPAPEGEPGEVACWRCGSAVQGETMSCRVRAAAAEAAGVVPAIQTAAAVLGGLQAEAVIEVLHGRVTRARRMWLDIRTGASLTADLPVSESCSGTHRRLPQVRSVSATVATSLGELVEIAHDQLGEDATLELPSPWVEHGVCVGCGSVMRLEAPGFAYTRAPYCHACGGPWDVVNLSPGEMANPVSRVRAGDPLLGRSAGAVGFAPGDLVAVSRGDDELALRLDGGAQDLFELI
ncbi:ThiF family adenylyltransferase [Baekduia sp. Peel2402]|uniref:ThiF family adenylyltransferase n=1 Tax=Baekduia sp. Peel2402 TaxID=3458296 RepID=UPI00403ED914